MALKITRETHAFTQLVPDGWKWMEGVGPKMRTRSHININGVAEVDVTWEWAHLEYITPNPTFVSRVQAYKTLCEVIRKYEVEIKIQRYSGSGVFKEASLVSIRPMGDYAKQDIAANFGCNVADAHAEYIKQRTGLDFNIEGWTMSDGTFIPPGEVTVNGESLACYHCKRVYTNLVTDPAHSPKRHFCRRCVRVCPGNGQDVCNAPVFQTQFHGCETHFPRGNCTGCNVAFEFAAMEQIDNGWYCLNCIATRCQRCERFGAIQPNDEHVPDGHDRYIVCRGCKKEVQAWLAQDRNEAIVLEKPCNMLIETHPNRPVRLCSVELEIASGAMHVLKSLQAKGLTRTTDIARYHNGDDTDFCYMEADGSLSATGGELIFPKMRLDNADTVAMLSEALGVVRKHVKAGDAKIDLSTGLHCHIDAHKMGYNNIRNVAIINNFLEDPIYRLSAANYTRHRGTHYAQVLPKGDMSTQEDFNARFFQNNVHHSVLNVAYFYSAVAEHCSCGQIDAGNPDACECKLGKCTVEFRVFNGTSSWKKIHAYIALCMSIVAYAKHADDMDVDDFPPCLYNAIGIVGENLKADWFRRLEWMFKNLYFTSNERDSLNYCIEHSELNKLTYTERSKLRGIEYEGSKYASRKPRRATVAPPPPKLGRRGYQPRYASRSSLNIQYVQAPPIQPLNIDGQIRGVGDFITLGEDGF